MKLAKNGYGTVEQILEMPIDLVLKIYHYEKFLGEYENEIYELNKPENK